MRKACAVFRLERATEVLELTYLGKYFACVNANWKKFGLPCEQAWYQGLDDSYIRLRSHRISHPAVSGLRQSHSITFSRQGFRPTNRTMYWNVRLDILKFSLHHSSTKFPV